MAESSSSSSANAGKKKKSDDDHSTGGGTCSSSRGLRVLLGVTGSVAAVKAPEIAVRLIQDHGAEEVKVLLTSAGKNFWDKAKDYDRASWEKLTTLVEEKNDVVDDACQIRVYYAEDEWRDWNRLGDPVLHIELRDWADCLAIAPLSANSLAKIAHGLCDDTLSCVVRAWDYGHGDDRRPGKPLFLAPAMNTAMWLHPLTDQQLSTVKGFWNNNDAKKRQRQPPGKNNNGVIVIPPQAKTLACGEIGDGALASVDTILKAITENGR